MANEHAPAVLRERSGVIEVEHGVIVLRTWDDLPIGVAPLEDNTLVSVSTDDVTHAEVLVSAADQFGPFEVTTRLLDGRPGDPGPEWEDVVELSVDAPGVVTATEMIENEPQLVLIEEPGQYRVRVSARGRGANGDDDHDDGDDVDGEAPIESYLFEAWPAPIAGPLVVRLTSPHAQATLNPAPQLVIPEGEAGLAAAARIGRDISGGPGARTLSGEVGSVSVERSIAGTRRRLFGRCTHLTTWSSAWLPLPSWRLSGSPELEVGAEMWWFADDHPDQLSGNPGAIHWTFLEIVKPERVVRAWNWLRPGHDGVSVIRHGEDVLPADSVITVVLKEHRRHGEPWTTISITHEGLPVEWLHDLETYWAYQLSIADHTGLGLQK